MGLTQDFYRGWGRGGETVQLSANMWPATQRALMSGGQKIPVEPQARGRLRRAFWDPWAEHTLLSHHWHEQGVESMGPSDPQNVAGKGDSRRREQACLMPWSLWED